jgi:adenosine deaminase
MIDKSIPLVELHRHLDGNIKPHTILKLAQKHNIEIGAVNLEQVAEKSQIRDKTSDLMAFLQKLDMGASVLADLDACYEVAFENMRDAHVSGLDYIELRFSPNYMSQAYGLDMADLIEAVADGIKSGSEQFGVKANLIGTLSRTYGAQICMAELDALLHHKDKIVAVDLAGDELGYPAALFVDHFKKARDANWNITVHAGEADGPQSIWNAINLLGATRIGHGVAASQDKDLMQYMANNKIAVESCPTSNYQTATVSELKNHPMKVFYENNMMVTLSTDDPAVSNIDLAHEYQIAHEVIGFSAKQLQTIQRNAVEAAFLSEQQKKQLKEGKRLV